MKIIYLNGIWSKVFHTLFTWYTKHSVLLWYLERYKVTLDELVCLVINKGHYYWRYTVTLDNLGGPYYKIIKLFIVTQQKTKIINIPGFQYTYFPSGFAFPILVCIWSTIFKIRSCDLLVVPIYLLVLWL